MRDYKELREEVEKKLKRLQKKAEKYGTLFSVTATEPYGYEVTHNIDGRKVKRIYEVYDLAIESDIIKKDGYTILSRIEHTPTGNIVTVFEGEMQKEWAELPAHCDHCNGNHGQKFTFIVDNGEERKQVGRTCLKEYCGIDPQMIGAFNSFFEDMEAYTPDCYDFDKPIEYGYETNMVLALALEAYAKQGYRKSDEKDSNKEYIIDKLNHDEKASTEFWKPADELSKAIENMSLEDAIDAMLNNVQTRIKGWYCKKSDIGYFAYAPVAYEKYMERIERQNKWKSEKEAMSASSNYVGTIGERMDFEVNEAKLLTSWSNDYGMTFLYRFIDKVGNVLMWFASTTIETEGISRIKATIKNHSERDGVKQTIINRVKVV